MSYESAPATRLVATACCCCGRPLVDSISVEAGVGPTCREKHGYAEAQGLIDPKAFELAMGRLPWDSAQGLANYLTHRIAVALSATVSNHIVASVSRDIAAIDALGYHRLAATLAERTGGPLIEVDEDRDPRGTEILVVKTPFSEELISALCRVPGRHWDATRKATTFPTSSAAALVTALRRMFPPTTLVRGRNGRLKILGGSR